VTKPQSQPLARWRVGRTLGRTLYRDGACVGLLDTPVLAKEIVLACNAALPVSLHGAEAPYCAQCGKGTVAYPGARFCGAACAAKSEAHEPLGELAAARDQAWALAARVRALETLGRRLRAELTAASNHVSGAADILLEEGAIEVEEDFLDEKDHVVEWRALVQEAGEMLGA